MEIDKQNKIAMIAALGWVVIASIFVVVTFNMEKNPYGPISLIHHGSFAFYLICSGLLIRALFAQLSFSFKEALLYSVIIGVGGNFIFMLIGLIYLKATWDVNFTIYLQDMTNYLTVMHESGDLEKVGEVSEEGFKKSIEKLNSVTAWNIVFNDFSIKMIISLILSFIIAVTMRKSSPVVE